jgi:uncharacterized protein YjiS (DUF1127 family)
MQAIPAQSVALLQNYDSRPSKILTTLATVISAVEDGFSKAEQYEALARKSDSELAALGLTREDLRQRKRVLNVKQITEIASRACYRL